MDTTTDRELTVDEAMNALNLTQVDYLYRLIKGGILRARKVNGRWRIDAASVADRRRRIESKASSKSNAAAERDRRRAEAEAGFVVLL